MVYDSVNNPAAGGSGSDICSFSDCCANTYSYSSRANSDADTWVNSYTNTYTDADTRAYMPVEFSFSYQLG